MSISQMSDNLNIISALSDEPNATDGLTATQLKAKFDEASGLIKSYVNDTLVPAINRSLPDGQYATDAGSTDSYAITLSPAPTTYFAGMVVRFKANTANTGSASLNVNALGDKPIKKNISSDLDTGDILANQMVEVIYDGTSFQMLSIPASVLYKNGLIIRSWTVAANGDTTPTVASVSGLIVSNNSSTSITGFDDAAANQEIHIVFSTANTTLVNSTSLRLAGNTNWTPTANSSIVLYKVNNLSSAWFEKCRMQY